MKAFRKWLFFLGLSLSISSFCFSQQYTLRDQKEIASRAQLTLNMYRDLLNVISISGLATDTEVKELIQNSYSDPKNPIFYSEEVIIEDDIKPSNLGTQLKQDKSIKEYLKYFDLTYVKTDNETIEFSNFETSNLKYRDHLFIKIKYTSQFQGRHKDDTASYKPTERVAELRVEKKDNQWKTFISSIVYYDPNKPVNSTENDVTLNTSVDDDGMYLNLIDGLKSESNSLNKLKEAEKISQYNNTNDSIFTYYMELGQIALDAEKFEEAFTAFTEAQQIYPYNLTLRQKVNELTRAQNRKSNSDDKKFEEAKLSAERAMIARNYAKAKSLYTEALRIKPEESSIKSRIDRLDKIIQKTAFLESKFTVGQYKGAIKDYNKAIREDKNNADYYFGRARCYEKLNQTKDAIEDYSKAIELDGNFVDALHSRAKLYLLTDQPHKAVADYTLIISNPNFAAEFYPERAKVRKSIGDHKGAVEDYNAAIELMPNVADYYYQRGLVYYLQNQLELAKESYSEAIKKDNNFINAYYQRGLVHLDLENVKAASSDFVKAKELGLEKDQLENIEFLASKYFSKAEGEMKMADYESALGNYINTILISPTNGSAWLRKGDAHFMLQDFDNAILNYHKAIKLDSISYAFYRRGMAYQQIKDIQSAHHDFQKYTSIGKSVAAKAEEKTKRIKAPGPLANQLAEESAEAYYFLGYAQLMTSSFAEALESLNKAISINKTHSKAFFARGATQFALNDYKKAIKDMEESVKLGHSEPLLFFSLGKAYEGRGKVEDAINSYSQTILLDPKFGDAYRQRFLCYKQTEQYKLAHQDIEVIFSLDEKFKQEANLVAHKGILELYLNQLQEANKAFDFALSLNENDGLALFGKACALAIENKFDESLRLYRKAFQTKQFEWTSIKKDPLIKPISRQKAFKELVKSTF